KLQLADGSMYEQEGKITKMSGVIDPSTGTVQMIAVFPNPQKLLKSGASGSIVLPRVSTGAIIIPQACVSEVQNKKFVYTLGKDNKVVYTEIQVDPQNDGNNYIVIDGLKPGDKYVTNGITKLNDGMEIVPITPERYQQKIDEQAKAMTAGEIVGAMQK
nr:efflux RND transporter periplasmic adaptor subunit [Prevotella sp.]